MPDDMTDEHEHESDEHEHDLDDDLLIVGTARTLRRWTEGGTERFVVDFGGGNVRRFKAVAVDEDGSNPWVSTRAKK